MATGEDARVRVWDPWLRLFHWSLAAAFFTAYATGDAAHPTLESHAWAGYAVTGLVAFRLAWGLVGPRYARFSGARIAPRAVLGYLSALWRGDAPRHLGHSPAGWAMTLALRAALTGLAGTGLLALAETEGAGPLAGLLPLAPADAEGRRESAASAAHALIGDAAILLALLHLTGVFVAVAAHGAEVLGAMITGDKARGDAADAPPD